MLEVRYKNNDGQWYNLQNRDDRESLHSLVDDIFADHLTENWEHQDNGEIELSEIHESISEQNELGLVGEWLNKELTIRYLIDDVRDYLDEMMIDYTDLGKGNIVAQISGYNILLTRDEQSKLPCDYKVYTENGQLTNDQFLKYGIQLDKVYYLMR